MLLKRLVDTFVAPRRCPVCNQALNVSEKFLCLKCLASVQPCTHTTLDIIDRHQAIANAIVVPERIDIWMHYDPDSPHAAIIKDVKYHGMERMGRYIGTLFANDLKCRETVPGKIAVDQIDVLLPMPMHWRKEIKRGYNQAKIFAQGIAQVLDIPIADNLIATKPHSTQTHLDQRHRAQNIQNCFALRFPEEFDGLNIAIVDDIITTGASIAEAAITISKSGARPATISYWAIGLTNRYSGK